MGKLKDALHLAVLNYIRTWPPGHCALSSLLQYQIGCPVVRQTWSQLQTCGVSEGVRKATTLKTVLLDRSDLFEIQVDENGTPTIALTEAAQSLTLEDGLPPLEGGAASLDELGAVKRELGEDGQDGLLLKKARAVGQVGPPVKAAKLLTPKISSSRAAATAASSSGGAVRLQAGDDAWSPCDAEGGTRSGEPYPDIVWTPELAARQKETERLEYVMARALYEAVLSQPPGSTAKIGQLGQDYKVAMHKKEPRFVKSKMQDLLLRWPDVFELLADGEVSLQPGAEAALPDAELRLTGEIDDTDLLMAERIDDPKDARERLQALRIELLIALTRRGGRAAIQELGQEPRLQHYRQTCGKDTPIREFAKMFPDNLCVAVEAYGQVIEVLSVDIEDMSWVDDALAASHSRSHAAWTPCGSARCKGAGGKSAYGKGLGSRGKGAPKKWRPALYSGSKPWS